MVFLIITFSSCFVSSAASPKIPQAKITHIWSYDWYEDNKEYFIENNYVAKYVYYDYGDYNDNSGYYVKVIEAKCRNAKGSNVKYQFAIREGKKKWEKYPPDGRSTLNVYDFPKNITISIKVRYVKTKNGKNCTVENRLPLRSNKSTKESICNCNLSLEGEVAEHIFHYPTTNYTIVWINNKWYYERKDSEEAPFVIDFSVSCKWAFLCFSTNCNFCNKKSKTKCKCECQVDY